MTSIPDDHRTETGKHFTSCEAGHHGQHNSRTFKQKLAAQHDCERTFQARQGLTKENKFQGLMEQGVSWNINS